MSGVPETSTPPPTSPTLATPSQASAEPSAGASLRASGRAASLRAAVAAVAVLLAAAGGWVVAGRLPARPGPQPPPCPARYAADAVTPVRAADPGKLVPVPLPQPRGPFTVRLCAYPSTVPGVALRDQVLLDATRTAELSGVLDVPDAVAVPPADRRPGGCAAGPVTLLLFQYIEGDPFVAEVDGGPCALVTTPARIERDRADAVRLVEDALSR